MHRLFCAFFHDVSDYTPEKPYSTACTLVLRVFNPRKVERKAPLIPCGNTPKKESSLAIEENRPHYSTALIEKQAAF